MPIVIPTEIECSGCQTTTAFGLMPTRVVSGMEAKCCPSCGGVLFVREDGGWMTVTDFFAAPETPAETPDPERTP